MLPVRLQGQDSLLVLRTATEPSPLTEGTLGWIRIWPDSRSTITGGEAGGEPLFFQAAADSSVRALIGVPVEVGDSLKLLVYRQTGEVKDTAVITLPVRRGAYGSEVLAVAPGFAKPDSAAAARIQREVALSREISRRSLERPPIWRGPFRLPRASRITSVFGTARVFNGEVQSRHLGTDFAGAVGAPVVSAGNGVVALVANFYLAGRAVYVDHGAGLVTAYFHLSRVEVRAGQRVRGGQRIGAVGQTGRVTGPHLHWVARYGTVSVDPMSLLQLNQIGGEVAEPGPARETVRPNRPGGSGSQPR